MNKSLVQVFLGVFIDFDDISVELLTCTFSFVKLIILYFSLLLADMDFLVKCFLNVHNSFFLFLLHLHFFFFKLAHDASFHLLCLKLDIFLCEFFLLEQTQLFSFLELANFLGNATFSLCDQLLSECFHFPFKALVNFIYLLNFASP